MDKDPHKRLGSKGGAKEIMDHPWFKGVNWEKVKDKKIKVPYKPDMKDKSLTHWFDT